MKSIDYVLGQPWAMLPDMVETLISIADRVNRVSRACGGQAGKAARKHAVDVEMRDGVAIVPVSRPDLSPLCVHLF
jgi:hypothetical protein